ncbi:MAG: 30S ribosomal protein S3 [Parcubacteria group bacterium GW2011_GWC2_42_6]|nr:MAG: 30S ribosomal protein S3 [Parcubacteria group bacterium GW2011_GWA2_42_11]KKS66505.1 MAG: 30S ribosomal protein S3 [Parcubacteria group bacterium GW2011_GWC2_42_6]KKT76505.1 MAG: 30S ribosomal protein S3 [Parcubacteria group bacterium GW2011_GWF2_44_7]
MGQKVHPIVFRLGGTQTWRSRWFDRKNYQKFLAQDVTLRGFLMNRLKPAGIDKIEIERQVNNINVIIYAARPGMIVGRGGAGVEDLKKTVKALLAKKFKISGEIDLRLSVEEVKNPDAKAMVVAQNIADQIEKRLPFRRTMKQALERVLQSKGVEGVKIMIKGRLDGNEIARKEWSAKGRIPLQTLRADIDYASATAYTTYGTVGIKVWIYKGEIFEPRVNAEK